MARIPTRSSGLSGQQGRVSPGRPAGMTLVTRGFGRNQNIVAQGFSLMSVIRDAVLRFIELGQSGTKRALREIQEVVVWAKLLRVNQKAPTVPIQGSVKVNLSDASQFAVRAASKISFKARSIFDNIKISINRVK